MDLYACYNELGLSRGASREEIDKTYIRLMRKWHPDINKSLGAGEKAKKINQAYQTIQQYRNNRMPVYSDSQAPVYYTKEWADWEQAINIDEFDEIFDKIFENQHSILNEIFYTFINQMRRR